MRCSLYVLKFENGKLYFGISQNPVNRLLEHKKETKRSNLPVHCAIRKMKVEQFVLVVGTRDYIEDLEIRAISAYQTCNRERGYNVSLGGDKSPMLVPELRDKMAASMRVRFENPVVREANRQAQIIAQNRPDVAAAKAAKTVGRKASAETKAKMSRSHKGRPKSPEHAAKIGASRKGKFWNAEQKARGSIAQKKRWARCVPEPVIPEELAA